MDHILYIEGKQMATNEKLLELIQQQTTIINELVGYVKDLVGDHDCANNLDIEMKELHKLSEPFYDE